MIGDVGFLFVRLLFAHIIADYILQPNSWVASKREMGWASPHLYYHGIVAGVLAYAFSGLWGSFVIPLVVVFTHIVIDGLTSPRSGPASIFIADQLVHIIILFMLSIVSVGCVSDVSYYLGSFVSDPKAWVILTGYLFLLWPSGILIGKFTQKWRDAIPKSTELNDQSLENAGKWIGFFERFLILTFILVQQYTAIGFLVAAKSIFRYPDRRDIGEYILIGTLISFLIAVCVGLLIQAALVAR